MIIIILGILIFVFTSKYKKNPLLTTKSSLKTLTIAHSVFFGFSAISLLSSFVFILTGSFFELMEEMILNICRAMDVSTKYVAEVLGDVSLMVNTVIWIAIIMDVAVFVFGLIALITGYKTISDKALHAAAEANTAAFNESRRNMYQQNYAYSQQNYGYSQQGYQNNTYNQNTQSYTTAQTPPPAPTPQPQAQTHWVCSCGSSNIAVANFCSHCGNKRP
ncbi:MAG: hypothetical protein E7490_03320 [Ruminococcaceae bacterium]|nr:hypothetical protein [Oscillospiraceae bacterium]